MGVINIRQHALDPAVVRAMAVAYDQCAESLVHSSDIRIDSNAIRTKVALAVVELAERGVRDPAELRDLALARLRLSRRAPERRYLESAFLKRDAAE